MLKKLTAILLAAMCIVPSASAANITEAQKEVLKKYNIMTGDEDGKFREDDNITRAEAVRIICSAGKVEKKTDVQPFIDVSPEHWAYAYICAAKDNGIVVGDGEGFFNPESNVTHEEMAKMIICLLGYGQTAYFMGGYPTGYTKIASELGITKDMRFELNTPVKRGDVGIMMYKSLDIPLVETSDDGLSATIMDGENGVERKTLKDL